MNKSELFEKNNIAGFADLSAASTIPVRTLRDWAVDRPERFEFVCNGVGAIYKLAEVEHELAAYKAAANKLIKGV